MSKYDGGLSVDHGEPYARNHAAANDSGGVFARLRGLFRCERGVAAIEFGLAAPILLAALIPAADLGIAFSQTQQLRQAVQAGAQYAAIHPWSQNAPTAIANAVTAATPLSGVTVSPAPYQQCGCPTGSGVTTTNCAYACSGGQAPGYYVVVSAQLPYTPVLPYSLLGSSTTLSAQSMVRIR